MTELKIPEVVKKAIESFQTIELGGKRVVCPYYINSNRKKDLRAMVGKGSPDEIIMEAKIWEKLKGVKFEKMSEKEIKQFLMDRGIGIDCSGFVTHVLDAWYRSETGRHIWNKLQIPQKGIYAKIRYMLRPVENLGANILTGEENSYPIKIDEVKPGDVIRSKWKKSGTHHIQLITRVEKDGDEVKLIEYTHSTPYYGDSNGVRVGQIRIIDSAKTLKEQEWLEKDEHGVNFSYEGFLTNVEDNGLRRVRAMEEII